MTIWTDERKAEARRLWMSGYSASLIAESIGNGCTKNSVIGLAHRGKWGQRRPAYARVGTPEGWMRPEHAAKVARIKASKARAHAPRPKAPPSVSLPLPVPDSPPPPKTPPPRPLPPPKPIPPRHKPGTYTLLDLRPGECKWPVNEPPRGGTYLFCGEPQFNGWSYCEHHSRVGFSGKGTARATVKAGWLPRPVEFGR